MRHINQYGLTDNQEAFVQAYARLGIASQAYTEAYPRAKSYSRNAIDVNAYRLANNAKIKLRLTNVRQDIVLAAQAKVAIDSEITIEQWRKLVLDIANNEFTSTGIRLRALELLGKHLGALDERLHIDSQVSHTHRLASVSDDDLLSIIAARRSVQAQLPATSLPAIVDSTAEDITPTT